MLKGKLVILLVRVLVVSMFVVGISAGRASVADSSIPDAGVSDSQVGIGKAEGETPPLTSATITITWVTIGEPGEVAGGESD